ncbi:hypothetical protein STEG23_030433 [Scotinomys teguina]
MEEGGGETVKQKVNLQRRKPFPITHFSPFLMPQTPFSNRLKSSPDTTVFDGRGSTTIENNNSKHNALWFVIEWGKLEKTAKAFKGANTLAGNKE